MTKGKTNFLTNWKEKFEYLCENDAHSWFFWVWIVFVRGILILLTKSLNRYELKRWVHRIYQTKTWSNKKTKNSVYAELGVCPAYGHTDCLIMAQGDKSNLLGVAYASVKEGKISGLSLCIFPTPDSAVRSGIYPGL